MKQKIEEEKNTGEDVKKTVAKSYKYPNPGPTGTTSAKTGRLTFCFYLFYPLGVLYIIKLLTLCFFR